MKQYRVSEAEHRALPWRVHSLLADMRVEDVWRFPLELEPEEDLHVFEARMTEALDEVGKLGLAGVLLRARLAVGRMLGWDGKEGEPPPRTIYARYLEAEGSAAVLADDAGDGNFSLVYRLPDEYLGEIENKTVLAAVHLGRVPLDTEKAAVHLAIYTEPKGRFGRVYMAAIKPFRLWIVYPTMMRVVAAHWEKHRSSAD